MDYSTLIPWLCTSLNAPNLTELQNWTETELYQYSEEALHDVGGRLLLFVVVDDSTALIANQGAYELAVLHIATIYAAADGVTLKPSTSNEMEMLNDNWEEAASGTPTRWIGDSLGLKLIRIYPAPGVEGILTLVYHQHPPDLPVPEIGETNDLKMPAVLGDYMAMKTLQQARQRQGDAQMLDVAATFEALGGIYEQCFEAYYGKGS